MVDRVKNWLEDTDSDEPIYLFSTSKFYHAALERGIQDRRVIANAIALVDATNAFAKKYPNVSYDHLANLILLGLGEDYYLVWGVYRWWRRVQLFFKQTWRRLRRRFR